MQYLKSFFLPSNRSFFIFQWHPNDKSFTEIQSFPPKAIRWIPFQFHFTHVCDVLSHHPSIKYHIFTNTKRTKDVRGTMKTRFDIYTWGNGQAGQLGHGDERYLYIYTYTHTRTVLQLFLTCVAPSSLAARKTDIPLYIYYFKQPSEIVINPPYCCSMTTMTTMMTTMTPTRMVAIPNALTYHVVECTQLHLPKKAKYSHGA